MRIAAILINYRTPDLTREALDALLVELSSLAAYRVFIVDNDSRDGSFEKLSKYVRDAGLEPRVRVVAAPRNGGYGYGINFGADLALREAERPEYLYVINTDAKPDPGSLHKLLEFMDANPRVGLGGSRIHGPDGETQGAAFRFPTVLSEFEEAVGFGPVSSLLREHTVSMPTPTEHTRVDWVPGTSMVIRTEVFESGVRFDETYFLYFEEIDYAQQVIAAGWDVYSVYDAGIEHSGWASTGLGDESKPWPDYYFDSRWRYFTKYHGPRYALACDVARATGETFRKVKCAIQRQPHGLRPRSVRGMVRAALRAREARRNG